MFVNKPCVDGFANSSNEQINIPKSLLADFSRFLSLDRQPTCQ